VHYATVRAHRGEAIGMVVENHEGRPTKLEGNPEHAGSTGSLDVISQAAILDLYDPDRSKSPKNAGKDATWEAFEAFAKAKRAALAANGGASLRVLMQPTNSPTLVRMRDALLQQFPQAKVYSWAPVNESNVREGARIAFGQPANPVVEYRFARVLLALDSDFLGTEAGMIRATRLFARNRKIHTAREPMMSRLYVVEPSYTTTGANADHRLRLPARQIETYLLSLAKELASRPGVNLADVSALFAQAPAAPEGVPAQWVKAIADDLIAARGRSAVVIGSRQPARLHALVHAVNAALDNLGTTIMTYPVVDPTERDVTADVKALAADLDGGKVDTVLILGGNPVYDAPADVKLADKLAKVATTIHLGHSVDETGSKCTWSLPRAHELEAWGDQRSLTGVYSVQQPMILPLFGARSDIEVLALFTGDAPKGYELVRAGLKGSSSMPESLHEQTWKQGLNRGLFAALEARPVKIELKAADIVASFAGTKPARALGPDNLELEFAVDPKLFDGRHANNPWLLELPDLMTKIVWDNAAFLSPATAKALSVQNGDVLTLSREGAGSVEIPAWVFPGQADNTVTVNVGWGRKVAGRYGNDAGFDVYPLRTSDALGFADGAKVSKTGKDHHLVQTQEHQSMEGRPLAIDATVEQYKKDPFFGMWRTPDPKTLPLWKPVEYKDHKWGMVIDLSSCTGCNACVVACQAENNIATVGKDQVNRNREMHWIRIDRYFLGDDESNPKAAIQPVACVQCEDAPCENVCPVNATAHSPEGLNDMAYNRCIGTRYCANNCPYKVRRFNYLEFEGGPLGSTPATLYGDIPETRKMQFNPDVTVRMRGVMEKCTYCVQRIQEAKIASKREERPIRDGEITPACAQTCPADAIHFGDLNDPASRVAKESKIDRQYHLLSELGTHPRTTYLGKIRNPNPAMGEG
jgi:molybdopterin-containing oxidoreductase family iron-sulfur binding subunit